MITMMMPEFCQAKLLNNNFVMDGMKESEDKYYASLHSTECAVIRLCFQSLCITLLYNRVRHYGQGSLHCSTGETLEKKS